MYLFTFYSTHSSACRFQHCREFLPCFDVVPEFLSVDWDVVLVHPVGVEDRTLEGLLAVDVREVAHGNLVDVLHRPEIQN